MAKRAASPAPVNEHLSDSAQKHLTTLRGEIESRLATLEEVLADPSRGESLAGLILDLSRIATEEAQAAAAHACLTTRTEADKQLAEQRASATAALEAAQASLRSAFEELERERTTAQDLRREGEQATLQLGRLSELAAAREKLERELQAAREENTRHKTAVADLQRTAGEVRQQLEADRRSGAGVQAELAAERATVADLRRESADFRAEAAQVAERLSALERDLNAARAANEQEQAEARASYERDLKEQAAAHHRAQAAERAEYERAQDDARVAYDTIAQDLERERTAAAYAHAELQSQVDALRGELDGERAQAAELRQAAQQADERNASFDRERAEAAAAYTELQSLFDALRAELDTERGQTATLRQAVQQAEERSASLDRERSAATDLERAHADLQSQIDTLRAELEAERQQKAALQSQFDSQREELAAERVRNAELLRAVQEAEERSASIDDESSGGAERDELESRQLELAALSQAALKEAHKALAQAQADLERVRESNNELREAADYADQMLASSRSNEVQMLANVDQLSAQIQRERAEAIKAIEGFKHERDRVVGELQAAQKWIDDLRAAEAEFMPKTTPAASGSKSKAKAASPATPPPAAAPPAAPSKKEEPDTITLSDEGWQTIRLTNRFIYNDGVPIQVNGDAGTLFDLSFSGCQILSPSALKPNQVVKIQLSAMPPVTCSGKVVWTRLEGASSAQLLSYRAGVRFAKADQDAIEAFAAAHKPTSIVPDTDLER